MATEKTYPLSIIVKAFDQATAPLRAIGDKIHHITEPLKEIGEHGKHLGEALGVFAAIEAFKFLGEVVEGVVEKLHGILEGYAAMGHAAERIGVSVDVLAGLQDAAKRAGAPVEALTEGMGKFNKAIGLLEAGKGKLKALLGGEAPQFLGRLKKATDPMERLAILAEGVKKLHGHIEAQTALAAAAGFGPELLPFLEKGGKKLTESMAHFKKLAGSQEEAAKAGMEFEEAMADVDAAMMRIKATIATALGPVLTMLAEQFTEFLGEHQEEIAAFIEDFAKHIPDAVHAVVGVFKDIIAGVPKVISAIGDILTVIGDIGSVLVPVAKFIVDLFRDTGDLIAAIAQKIVDAVEAVKKAAGWVGDRFTGGDAILGSEGAAAADEFKRGLGRNYNLVGDWHPGAAEGPWRPGAAPQRAEVTVNFVNPPPGTRVNTDPRSTAGVTTNVGSNMWGFGQ